eukprot:403375951
MTSKSQIRSEINNDSNNQSNDLRSDSNQLQDSQYGTTNISDESEIIKDLQVSDFIDKTKFGYQDTIVQRIIDQWKQDELGSIVFIDTGTGKSYIALKLIKHIFNLDSSVLNPLSEEQKQKKIDMSDQQLREAEREQSKIGFEQQQALNQAQMQKKSPKVFFIVPTQHLVEQQSNVINVFTENLIVRQIKGGTSQKIYDPAVWPAFFKHTDIFVIIAKKFIDLIKHGLLSFDDIDLLIFDEAHHTQQDHPYNLIMSDYFYFNLIKKHQQQHQRALNFIANPEKNQIEQIQNKFHVTRILGLTASPIKSKQPTLAFKHELKQILQELSNNLFSRFVAISQEESLEMKNHSEVILTTYKFDFEDCSGKITYLEKKFIIPLIESVNLSKSIYIKADHVSMSQTLLELLNENLLTLSKIDNDQQLIKFQTSRLKLLDIKVDETKKCIDLSNYQTEDEKKTVILVIILLKNLNNMVLELGSNGVMLFIVDLEKDLIEGNQKWSPSQKQALKDLFNQFKHDIKKNINLLNESSMSNKIQNQPIAELIKPQFIDEENQLDTAIILNEEENQEIINQIQEESKQKVEDIPEQNDQNNQEQIKQQKQAMSSFNLDNPQFDYNLQNISPKAQKLIETLDKEYEQRKSKGQELKAIIFVKDRIIAEYLKRILSQYYESQQNLAQQKEDNQSQLNTEESSSNQSNILDMLNEYQHQYDKFRFGLAIGQKGRGLINKAVNSTNKQKILNQIDEMEVFENLLGDFNFSKVKMTSQQLTETIQSFKSDKLNVLIATNVIEEGLDIPNCNLTKGRARQKNSKFIFMCSQEQRAQQEQEIQGFKETIEKIQELAYCEDEEIVPTKDVLSLKVVKENKFFRTQKNAMIMSRDCPSMIEAFMKSYTEDFNKGRINPLEVKSINVSNPKEKAYSKDLDPLRLKEKTKIVTKEQITENTKFFRSVLIFPEIIKNLIDNVKGTRWFHKKKESQNHTYMLAVERLHKAQLIDDHLFPVIRRLYSQSFLERLSLQSQPVKQVPKANPNQNQNTSAKKQKQQQQQAQMNISSYSYQSSMTAKSAQKSQNQSQQQIIHQQNIIKKEKNLQEREQLNEEQKRFQMETNTLSQQMMPKLHDFGIQGTQDLVAKLTGKKLYCIIIEPVNQESNYPFLNTKNYIGIIQDEDMNDFDCQYVLQQENKQILKNGHYLYNLEQKNLINYVDRVLQTQYEDELSFTKKAILLDTSNMPYETFRDFSEHLKLFHTFIFFFLYNGQYEFYKRVITNKFKFSRQFRNLISLIAKDKRKTMAGYYFTQQVLGISRKQLEDVLTQIDRNQYVNEENGRLCDNMPDLQTNIIPIKIDKNGKREIDFKLIQDTYDYINTEILKLVFQNYQVKDLQDKFGLIDQRDHLYFRNEIESPNKNHHMKYIQVCESNQNLYQIMESNKVNEELWQSKEIKLLPSQVKKIFPNVNESILMHQYGEFLSVQEHYFAKTGIYLHKKENQIFFKCSKQRHFLDFSQQKIQLLQESQPGQQKIEQPVQEIQKSHEKVMPQNLQNLTKEINDYFQQNYYYNLDDNSNYDDPYEESKVSQNHYNNNTQILNETFYGGIQIIKDIDYFFTQAHRSSNDNIDLFSLKQNYINLHQDCINYQEMSDDKFTEASQYFLKNPLPAIEALSSPTANQLFLCHDKNWDEGKLDLNRIKRVSNMRFIKVNQDVKLYEYMISEQSKIYNVYVPIGFENKDYQQNVKQKHINEIQTKILHLKKQAFMLELEMKENFQQSTQDYVTDEYIETIKLFISQNDLKNYLRTFKDGLALHILIQEIYNDRSNEVMQYQQKNKKEIEVNDFTHSLLYRVGTRWINELSLKLPQLKKIVVTENLAKCENKLQVEMLKRKNLENSNREKKQFQSKQLADVVESVTGALASKCGLFTAREFLMKKYNLLEFSVEQYNEKLNELQLSSTSIYKVEQFKEKIDKVESILGYTFKYKEILLQALTHKSTKESLQNQANQENYNDYERLEFLGDSILNFLVAQHFFLTTQDKPDDFKPKQLHKSKTSIVNNVILSLIVIEKGIYESIIYNQLSEQFKTQFEAYVQTVKKKVAIVPTKILAEMKEANIDNDEQAEMFISQGNNKNVVDNVYKKFIEQADKKLNPSKYRLNEDDLDDLSSDEELKEDGEVDINNLPITLTQKCKFLKDYVIDLDDLYKFSLKIFGDIFESIIGAVFIDSKCLQTTSDVLFRLLQPYMVVYADIKSAQDHKRTTLLELWNSKNYAKRIKISHINTKTANEVQFKGKAGSMVVFKMTFKKDEKNKIRTFYKEFLEFITSFIKAFESQNSKEHQTEEAMISHIDQYSKKWHAKAQQQKRDELIKQKRENERLAGNQYAESKIYQQNNSSNVIINQNCIQIQ